MVNRYTLLAITIFAGLVAWSFWPRETPVVGESKPLPPAKEVRTVERVIYKPKFIYVYSDKSKAKLNLPPAVAEDESKKLIATGKLDAEEREYSLSTVLDTKTGESVLYARPDPLPWIGPGKRGTVGVAYGIRDGETMGRVYASRDLLQVKALRAGVGGSVDSDGQYFAGGYVEYRF